MATNYQDLLDLLNPKKEEELFTPVASTENQLMTPVSPTPEPTKEVAPTPVNTAKITPKQQESDNIQNPDVRQALDRLPKDSESQTVPSQLLDTDTTGQKPETELERLERMLSESRSRDRMLKVGGAIGDALATIINARSQMGAKVPGVQVQQGAGLGKVADMFATAPEIQSDVAAKREAMLRQYAELARGQRAKSRIEAQKEIAQERNKALKEAAGIRASGKGEKEAQPSFEEKERIKAGVKEEIQIAKENRELKKQLEPAIAAVDDQIKNVKDAINLINESKIAGTGPLDQYFAGATPEGQLLKKALRNIQLDTLVTKFQGMSRAVDTETDRKFFQETQPSMGNFETTNKKMLNDILKRLEGIKERSQNKLKEISSQNQVKSQPIETQQQKATNLVKIKGPSGQEATMTEEKAQKYLSKPGYTRIE